MASSQSQHRCVFVGNIPYDATEEQLIEICQEVGPVVSFRLVIDRETGKPKGYGFCEYKDEETALSARRNLQGYEINGRQLRVDFAENDKGTDRNKDQWCSRAMRLSTATPYACEVPLRVATTISDWKAALSRYHNPQKQVGIPAVQGDSAQAAQHQPIGLHIAITAAAVMTAALGGAQTGIQSNQNDVKAQIMLGMVTPQMLQLPNLRQVSDQTSQSLMNEGLLSQPQQTLVQTVAALPPYGQSNLQSGMAPYIQEGQVSTLPHNPLAPNQLTTNPKPPMQPRIPLQHYPSNQFVQLGTGQSNLMHPSVRPPPLGSLSVRPPIQPANSAALNQQSHAPYLQHPVRVGNSTVSHNIQMVRPDASFQAGPSTSSGIPQLFSKEGNSKYSNMSSGVVENTGMVRDIPESFTRPSKLTKLNDGRGSSLAAVTAVMPVSNGSSHMLGSSSLPVPAVPKAEVLHSDQQSSQSQLPSDVESALLQQVLNLTPEQLSSLPPDQQQQVIQLQQALKRDQMQHS
ncbi:hypothetical protein TSUD_42170 [Trifolium subterraneum]|uniref:RRM domain-containing protein n=1 Tax=Trifolium subterraneum TaxID=3900 RepID=A0A2Z6LHA4_TRISU|nr:hypothetical protein TSUD_42170 [Trifolium subterraneum]